MIKAKVYASSDMGLKTILCVSDTAHHRETCGTMEPVGEQLSILKGIEDVSEVVINY